MIFAMQIHLYLRHHRSSESDGGLAQHFAGTQLQEHLLVLGSLSATYWSAEQQRRLFNEAIAAVDGAKKATPHAHPNPNVQPAGGGGGGGGLGLVPTGRHGGGGGEVDWVESRAAYDPMVGSHDDDGLEEYFISFNPFMGSRSGVGSSVSSEWMGGAAADADLGLTGC